MSRLARAGLVSILLLTLVTACMSPKGNSVAEKRQAAQSMRSKTLAQLYEVHPYAKSQIDQASHFVNAIVKLAQIDVAFNLIGRIRKKKVCHGEGT